MPLGSACQQVRACAVSSAAAILMDAAGANDNEKLVEGAVEDGSRL
jgi:hypothetical protein